MRAPGFALPFGPVRLASDEEGDAPDVCTDLDDPREDRTIELAGPSDNPDPHFARVRETAPWPWFSGIGPLAGVAGGDRDAATVSFGRDDSLGRDPRSSAGSWHGETARDAASCFDAPLPAEARCREAPARGDVRVVVGPVAANVPRFAVAAWARAVGERSRACYERALATRPALRGAIDVAAQIRGDDVRPRLVARGVLAAAPDLLCCVHVAHEGVGHALPTGTRADAAYTITLAPK